MPFRESIVVSIEHGHANKRPDELTSVAFWYQTEPHRAPDPAGRGRARAAATLTMRLLVASDLHASEVAWRKLLNAVRLGIWKADAVLVAGDLSGKSLVALVKSNGSWHGQSWWARMGRQERG